MSRASNAGTLRGFCFLSLSILMILTGCSRGCASRWLTEKGVGDEGRAKKTAPFLTGGTDCPDGLARCVDGVVEVSLAGFIDPGCKAGEKGCACPWERVDECSMGCEVDDLVVDLPRERALVQLCRSEHPAFTAASGTAPGVCDDPGYRCDPGAFVVKCGANGGAPRVVAKCSGRCTSISSPIEDSVSERAASAVLCVRN